MPRPPHPRATHHIMHSRAVSGQMSMYWRRHVGQSGEGTRAACRRCAAVFGDHCGSGIPRAHPGDDQGRAASEATKAPRNVQPKWSSYRWLQRHQPVERGEREGDDERPSTRRPRILPSATVARLVLRRDRRARSQAKIVQQVEVDRTRTAKNRGSGMALCRGSSGISLETGSCGRPEQTACAQQERTKSTGRRGARPGSR